HDTSSLPPSHVGGVAFASHLPDTSQLAWHLASALNDALHSGGENAILSAADALPCAWNAVLMRSTAASHQNLTRASGAPGCVSSRSAFEPPAWAIALQAPDTSSSAPATTAPRSALA